MSATAAKKPTVVGQGVAGDGGFIEECRAELFGQKDSVDNVDDSVVADDVCGHNRCVTNVNLAVDDLDGHRLTVDGGA